MQLLICPGYHSADLTHDFLQSLLKVVQPERLWILPMGPIPGAGLPWLLNTESAPHKNQVLHVIGFSAGVVAAYPLVMAWQGIGGTSRLIALDGWGMPLLGMQALYRMSHDRWTHDTTYFPTACESKGYFYAEPAVEHLKLWQSPQVTKGIGAIGTAPQPMTALEFIGAVVRLGCP